MPVCGLMSSGHVALAAERDTTDLMPRFAFPALVATIPALAHVLAAALASPAAAKDKPWKENHGDNGNHYGWGKGGEKGSIAAPAPIAGGGLIGIGVAVQSLVGQNLAAGKPQLAERATWTALTLGLVYQLAFASLYLGAP